MTILAAITTPATARTALSQVGICLPQPLHERYDAARYGVCLENVRDDSPVPESTIYRVGPGRQGRGRAQVTGPEAGVSGCPRAARRSTRRKVRRRVRP